MNNEILELELLFDRLINDYKELKIKSTVEEFIHNKSQGKKFNLEGKILSTDETINKYKKDFSFIIHKMNKSNTKPEKQSAEKVVVSTDTPEQTFSQKLLLAIQIEKEEKEAALVRMGSDNTSDLDKGQTRDFVAKQVGLGSGKQYEKAKFVYQNADKELLQKLDSKLISIHKAHQMILEAKKSATG